MTSNLKNVKVTVQNQIHYCRKVWCRELWFLCTALHPNKIYLPLKFQVSSLNTYWVMLRTKFINENEQRAHTLKVCSFELWFLCTALLHNEIYLPMKCHVNALHSLKGMLQTKFKYENQQRAITPKVWCQELWFLCIALLLNKIYLPMKFQVSSLNTYGVMLRTKFKNDKGTKGNNSKNMMSRVMVLVHCTSP